jgi:hypothetical protein
MLEKGARRARCDNDGTPDSGGGKPRFERPGDTYKMGRKRDCRLCGDAHLRASGPTRMLSAALDQDFSSTGRPSE